MKLNSIITAISIALLASTSTAAGNHAGGHHGDSDAIGPSGHCDVCMLVAQTNPSNNMAEGEIRKVDKDTKKITIKHSEIENLDMPGMTMIFQVKDTAMLDKVKAGDKVKFTAEKSGGAIVITEIELTK